MNEQAENEATPSPEKTLKNVAETLAAKVEEFERKRQTVEAKIRQGARQTRGQIV